jgi:PAS domain S-box-containing protein
MGLLLFQAAMVVCVWQAWRPAVLQAQVIESAVEGSQVETELSSVVIQLRDLTFWREYKWRLIGAGILVTLQSLLIVALLLERSRKNAAARLLAESEERYRNVVESQTELICRYQPDSTLTFVNDAYCRYFEKNREDLIGSKFLELIPPHAQSTTRQHIQYLIESGNTHTNEHEVIRPDGSLGWHQWIDHVISRTGVVELQGIGRDITERKALEEHLLTSEQELIELTRRLFNTQDEERRRIARELHDSTAQNLFAVSVNLAKLSQLSSIENDDARNLIAECQSLGDQSLKEIRTLSYLLHPPLLDQAGLVSALQWYVEGFGKRSGIYIQMYAEPIGRLPSDIEMALFRVVQEALTNVRRHSASETASIRLQNRAGEVLLEIKDHGHGIGVVKQSSDNNGLISPGVGIPGMKQRLRQLGGKLEIVSDHKGTTISAVVPIGKGANHDPNTGS